MKTKKVSVVMLNWNTPEMTIECINSVLQSDYKNIEVNVVDNGSVDNSYEILTDRYRNLVNVYRIDKNIGYAMGMNYGLKKARNQNPDYFLIINNDTIIDKNAITQLVKTALKHENLCVVTGKVFHFDDRNRLQTVGNRFDRKKIISKKIGWNELDTGQYDNEEIRDMVDDVFLLLPIQAYLLTNGYSNYFYMNYEQTDMILRLIDLGFKPVYTPNAKLWHKGSYSTGGIGNPYMMYWEGKSNIIIHKMHQNNFDFMVFYITNLVMVLWSLMKGCIGSFIGKTKNLKSRYARFRGVLSGTIWIFNRENETGYNPFY
ncbi:glycosyltransferase family 2 protein [Desulfotignum phosphitoxidans]|uniref:Putative glycosyl transferase, family 2 n=1 Tax=Desulfotignum phosphitoxidans DSM 13687 TaxID=1286635 RepID=S0FRF8_9BACT|nr:glycosyltransferase family 2 protein [Desulfotignum phosphitoxidans]EMS77658.1 putative glycosyl transferase, family 2 [Desulfotignum phosphitoxidans DSM 13687]